MRIEEVIHICPINECTKPVHHSKLMCYGCWRKVSPDLQRRIYETYKPTASWQSREYFKHRKAAIDAVNLINCPVKFNPLPE